MYDIWEYSGEKSMRKIAVVDQNRCVACGVCMRACPRGALSVWRGCYAQADGAKCVGCGLCEKNCPAGCIVMEHTAEDARKEARV